MSAISRSEISAKSGMPGVELSFQLPPFVAVLPSPNEGICQRARNLVARVSTCIGQTVETHEHTVSIATGFVGVVSYTANARIFNLLLGLMFQSSTAAPSDSSILVSQVFSGLKATKVASLILVPIALASTIKEAIGLAGEHRVDAGLKTVDNLAWTVETSSMSLSGLNMLGVVSDVVGNLAATAIIGSWGVSSVVVGALNLKHLIESKWFLKELEKSKSDEEVIKKVMALGDDHHRVKHFGVNGETLRIQLARIQAVMIDRPKEAGEIAKTTADLLKKRITQKNFSNKLAILCSVVTLIAVAILMFSPLAPLGYSILIITSAILLYKAFYDRRRVREFNERLTAIALPPPGPTIAIEVPVVAGSRAAA